MKYLLKTGDLFTTTDQLIAHGVNCQGVMNSGVAKIIRDRYPQAYDDYRRAWRVGKKLGDIEVSELEPIRIAHLFTQQNYGNDGGKYVSYEAIRSCFNKLNYYCNRYQIQTVSMPKIGAGLGGGHWPTIERILIEEFRGPQVTVWALD
jgi:O-acetyl-ADP-ribose deacetylase (regulator of RNase III)